MNNAAAAWMEPASMRDSFDSLDDGDDERRSYRSSPRLAARRDPNYSSDDDFGSTPARKAPAPVRFPASSLRGTPPPSSSSSTSSPFADSASPSHSSPSRPSLKKAYSTKPWDSEDEDLMGFTSQSRSPPQSEPQPPLNGKTDAFDFSQVDVDFSLGQSGGRATLDYGDSPTRGRSRASTGGKGLGSAIAKFDFVSAEVGALLSICFPGDCDSWGGD